MSTTFTRNKMQKKNEACQLFYNQVKTFTLRSYNDIQIALELLIYKFNQNPFCIQFWQCCKNLQGMLLETEINFTSYFLSGRSLYKNKQKRTSGKVHGQIYLSFKLIKKAKTEQKKQFTSLLWQIFQLLYDVLTFLPRPEKTNFLHGQQSGILIITS